ncbi:MAG: hypothetical protein ABW032_08395 [Burkholderiaceae bacterium]
MKKYFTAHVVFAATALASQQVWALGFGRVVSDAVLGQNLSVTVSVHVEPGERFAVDCAAAEVYFGEDRLQPNTVRTAVERGGSDTDWLVKVSTTSPIGEPVIEVALDAGCEHRFMRRFTLFADPPLAVGAGAPLALGSQSTGARALAPLKGSAAAAGRFGAGRAAQRGKNPAADASAAHAIPPLRKGPTLALANELNSPKTAPARRGAVAVADAANPRKRGSQAPDAAAAQAPRLVLDGGYAHLKLDIDEPVVSSAAAASGAKIGLLDLDDADKQLRALEQSIQTMRRVDQANRVQTAQLQAQLNDARSRSAWLPYVMGLLALALALASVLALRLRGVSRRKHSDWFQESELGKSPAPAAPIVAPPLPQRPAAPAAAAATDAAPSVGGAVVGVDSVDDAVSASAPEPAPTTTAPLDRVALAAAIPADAAAPRELSVEELLDLEQQADFFIALGQEDAAVDLLMSHLRSAGGQSPLPYTKLLEIYRRQGDRSAYERTRARFNRRFNVYAPDWDTGPSSGRSLEDYPETIALVQAAWPSPIDAMAVLEGLLFKRDDTSELFDLPAYRDVLVLYSLARDLWQQGGGSASTQVDVLLPLDDSDALPYPPQSTAGPAHRINGLDLPLNAAPREVPTSYEMSDFAPTGMGSFASGLDLPLLDEPRVGRPDEPPLASYDDSVRATLDALSLEPVEPTPPPASPLDWQTTEPPLDDGLPAKKR